MLKLSALIFVLLFALLGCSTGPGPGAESQVVAGPTFHEDVEPILQKSCLNCHFPGRIAPFALVTYEDAKIVSSLIVNETQARRMPPFGAQDTSECQSRMGWKDDLRLSQQEIDTLLAWHEAGAPEGDPAKAPPPFVPDEPGLANWDIELVPQTPFVTSGDQDQFRCFLLDPALAQDKYIEGMTVVPGNSAVVHHVLTFRSDRNTILPSVDADGGFTCFGGPPGDLIYAWAPGGLPFEFAQGVGAPIGPQDVLVMQIHYHPAGTTQSDLTKFQIRFTNQVPQYRFGIGLIGNAETASQGLLPGPNDNGVVQFRIPANVSDHVESMQYTVGDLAIDHVKLYMIGTHMHYVGRDMKVEITRQSQQNGDPASECLIQTPDWQFDWQRFYTFNTAIDDLPRANTGDVFQFRCQYDNTLDNPDVARALKDQNLTSPIDVYLGESTLEEMCLFALGYLIPNN